MGRVRFHTLDLQKLSQQQRAQVDEVLRGKTGIALPPPKSSVFDMTDVGDREDEADPLPAKFSELTDEHFPLFVSYDRVRATSSSTLATLSTILTVPSTFPVQLLSLLEADLGLSYGRTVAEVAAEEPTDELERGPSYGQLVTYETFLGAYWDHFNQTLTAGLDPALVWAEILGVIRFVSNLPVTRPYLLSLRGADVTLIRTWSVECLQGIRGGWIDFWRILDQEGV